MKAAQTQQKQEKHFYMKNKSGKIGIGITTHNRREIFDKGFEHQIKFLPEGAKIVVVDDASDVPVNNATFRFDKNAGIASGKNKCLELLEDCEHVFLFDDDCYPIVDGWAKPYVESDEPHLMYLFKHFRHARIGDAEDIYQDEYIKALSHPRGCMLYLHRSAINLAGGMDTGYARWGFEHGDLSNRIHNLGLTTFPYMDIPDSSKMFYSADFEQAVESTVKWDERDGYLQRYQTKYNDSKKSRAFFPYMEGAEAKPNAPGSATAVVCQYLNGKVDVQRQTVWEADFGRVQPLADSVTKFGHTLHVLNNCFAEEDRELVKFHRVGQSLNPYIQRWLASWQFLRSHPEIKTVCLVDATDVEMLKDPFNEIKSGVLYVGDEKAKLNQGWINEMTKSWELKHFISTHPQLPLLNCGVVCGDREIAMWLCRQIFTLSISKFKKETVEMPLFNFVCHALWNGELVHGRQVTTIFKHHETESSAWFKHK